MIRRFFMSQNSRMLSRHKRKKSNTILNILIGVVLVLIVTVVWNIVSDDEETVKEVEPENTSVEPSELENKTEEEEKELVTEEIKEEESTSESEESTSETADSPSETPAEEESILTEGSDDPNVIEVEVNQNWQPIGTSQSGEHVSIYDKDSIDWKEKISAIAYATKLNESDMYIKHLGNGGSPQKSVGTVTSKDSKEIYRVYLEWIDGQGWKPTKKETLKTLP